MNVNVSQQMITSLYALLLGAALGVVYDVFRVLRLVGFKAFLLVFLEDILFFAICAISIFSFYMQFSDGKFRIYIFILAVTGFIIYFLTLGKLVFFVIQKIYKFVMKIIKWIYKKLVYPIIRRFFAPILDFFRKKCGKITKFLKNLLPKILKMLYNNWWKSKRKGSAKSAESTKGFFC